MRHRVQGRKLNLPSDQRMALLKNQVRSLIATGHIVTTEARAKEVRRMAERLITRAREDTVHNRRQAAKVLATKTPSRAVQKPAHYKSLSPTRKARVTAAIKGRKKTPTGRSTRDFVSHLFVEVAPKYRDRNGGYTRIYRLGRRRGDAAMLVRLELVVD